MQTIASEVGFLEFSDFHIFQMWWIMAFSEEGECGVSSQPLSQPRQVTVTHQVVVVDTAENKAVKFY